MSCRPTRPNNGNCKVVSSPVCCSDVCLESRGYGLTGKALLSLSSRPLEFGVTVVFLCLPLPNTHADSMTCLTAGHYMAMALTNNPKPETRNPIFTLSGCSLWQPFEERSAVLRNHEAASIRHECDDHN